MAGNFFYSKVYKGGFDIKSLENARPRRYNSKIWWSIHKRRFNIVENKNRNTAAIGVFDSGVGGLTVTREIMRQLPNENVVYFGDTARVPYGSKSKNNIIRFSRQIIRFLKTKNVKAIVIACNTASALALETVKEEFDIPMTEHLEQEVSVMCNLSQGIRQKGRVEGRMEGRFEERLESIRALMETAGISSEQAMDMLKVKEQDRPEVRKARGER